MHGYCAIEHTKALHELEPYEHLAQIYRLCFQHHASKVHGLQAHVEAHVRAAMMSLSSADPLPNYNGTLEIIWNGSKKASGMSYLYSIFLNTC